MPLFQIAVLNKYLAQQDNDLLEKQYSLFKNYFLNPTIQNNIIASKEEEFQEGFLRELFVKILGYTINPEPDFNLRTEQKNIKDAKKADGAIVDNGNILAVIELKGTDTPNLNSIEIQAFNYKNNQINCRYIITSNFHKLRFYIDNAIEHIEWDLFKLTYEQFKLLYLCLCKEAVLDNLPAKIKQESITEEESITKKLYKEYSTFKRQLFNNIVEHNHDLDKLLLFKKTQKLLDRFLFLFFAEDRMLVPPNSVRLILAQWIELKEKFDEYQPLYDRFKKYFSYLNEGYIGKQHEIFAYNGGLFAPDEILDTIKIEDTILYEATLSLSRYDYNSEVDVNILGHIFEHSLTEIEELEKAITSSEVTAVKTTKRKKDGVFYTPKYITKYIVENTVGTLCKSKKEELNIQDEDYHPLQKKKTVKLLLENLNKYRDWLLQITIVDPACGSGAFLNQALEFLIAEHNTISELEANITGSSIVFDVENSILENNLFGVDINEESVDIAKLSLWLRTARKGRKLNSLNNNIKCGNSLIDDETVAGDKAFNWQNEFQKIFENGGFDVVIGNPPWGAKLPETELQILVKEYPLVPTKVKDTYLYFILLSIKILKAKGELGLIVPNTWLLINNASSFRKYLLSLEFKQIIDYGDNVFADAIVESTTIIVNKNERYSGEVFSSKYREGVQVFKQNINKNIWLEDELHRIVLEYNEGTSLIIKKMEKVSTAFSSHSEIIFGIKPYQVGYGEPVQTQEIVDNRIYHSKEKLNEEWKPLVTGTDVNRYSLRFNKEFIKYGKWLMYSSNHTKIESEKLLLRRTSHDLRVALDDDKYYPQNSLFIITSKYNLKYILCLMNSKLFDFIYKSKCPQVGKIFAEVKPSIIKNLPIANPDKEDVYLFILKADIMLSKNKELLQVNNQFQKLLISKFENININTKLEKWHTLSFADFNKELTKQKIKLSLQEQSEWLTFFEQEKQKALAIKNEINMTDKEIDKMVYKLYDLTEEEIKVIENA